MRSSRSQQPLRISSYVVAVMVILVRSKTRSPFSSSVTDARGMATNFFWT